MLRSKLVRSKLVRSKLVRSKLVRLGFVATAIGVIVVLTSSSSNAAQACRTLKGRYAEHAVSDGCTSPVGLCIAGDYSGDIKGTFAGEATSATPTADTPTTGVLLFTSNSTIT